MIKTFIIKNIAIWLIIVLIAIIIKKLRKAGFEDKEVKLCWFVKIVLFIQCTSLLITDWLNFYKYLKNTNGEHSLLYFIVGMVAVSISWIATDIAIPERGPRRNITKDFPFMAILIGLSIYYILFR